MNYFGAEAANLIECAIPYTNWIFNQAVVVSVSGNGIALTTKIAIQ